MDVFKEHFVIKKLSDLEMAVRDFQPSSDTYLGEILLEMKIINRQQLDHALALQDEKKDRHIGRILHDMNLVSSDQINIALARKFGIPYVQLNEFDINTELLSLVPAHIAIQYNTVPLAEIDGKLVLAMENPLDFTGVELIRFKTNRNITAVMASSDDISLVLNKYTGKLEEDEALEETNLYVIENNKNPLIASQIIEKEASKKPIVRMLNSILLGGVQSRASDINIRPEKDIVKVYYRIDGKLQLARRFNKTLLSALVSRIKIVGEMNIAERRLPQEGRARMVRGGNSIDLRMSVIPTVKGESVVIRILDKETALKPIQSVGFTDNEMQKLKSMIIKPHGMVLVVGPTGSGKSTTLYAILNEMKKTDTHILTIEDPVEYEMEGIEQVHVNEKINFTFGESLKRFLRHDPDVIMIGEIRDNETAAIANKAALTGHFVLSTLHTNDAPGTITRLIDMGVEPYVLSSTLLGVLSQRLVRLICHECKVEDRVENHIRKTLDICDGTTFYRGMGCRSCGQTGYSGRIAIFEILPVTNEIATLINEQKSTREISNLAVTQGMVRLVENAMRLAREGKTTLDEVMAIRID